MYITINTGLHYPVHERVWYGADTGVLRFYWDYILIPNDEWTWNLFIDHRLVTREQVVSRKADQARTVAKDELRCLELERRITQAGYEFERIRDIRSIRDKIYVSYEVKIPTNLSPREVVRVFSKIARPGFLEESNV